MKTILKIKLETIDENKERLTILEQDRIGFDCIETDKMFVDSDSLPELSATWSPTPGKPILFLKGDSSHSECIIDLKTYNLKQNDIIYSLIQWTKKLYNVAGCYHQTEEIAPFTIKWTFLIDESKIREEKQDAETILKPIDGEDSLRNNLMWNLPKETIWVGGYLIPEEKTFLQPGRDLKIDWENAVHCDIDKNEEIEKTTDTQAQFNHELTALQKETNHFADSPIEIPIKKIDTKNFANAPDQKPAFKMPNIKHNGVMAINHQASMIFQTIKGVDNFHDKFNPNNPDHIKIAEELKIICERLKQV